MSRISRISRKQRHQASPEGTSNARQVDSKCDALNESLPSSMLHGVECSTSGLELFLLALKVWVSTVIADFTSLHFHLVHSVRPRCVIAREDALSRLDHCQARCAFDALPFYSSSHLHFCSLCDPSSELVTVFFISTLLIFPSLLPSCPTHLNFSPTLLVTSPLSHTSCHYFDHINLSATRCFLSTVLRHCSQYVRKRKHDGRHAYRQQSTAARSPR